MNELEDRLKKLGVSTSRLAKMVGISQPAMRLIVKGVNKARPEHDETIKKVLKHLSSDACETCGRAFLEENDVDNGDAEAKTQSRKTTR